MSCEAKVWQDDNGWHAVHDGTCRLDHNVSSYELVELLQDVEECLQRPMVRWLLRIYPDGQAGLVGFIA